MTTASTDLASLLGSRICHDLISPIGAISNGLELLKLSGAMEGPEIDLIAESVENANARIRFFRVAFGGASPDHFMSAGGIRSILDDITRGKRLNINWAIDREMPRDQVKLAFLLIQCFEVSLPRGGEITIHNDSGECVGTAQSDHMRFVDALWGQLSGAGDADVNASEIQFKILGLLLDDAGKHAKVTHSSREIQVSF